MIFPPLFSHLTAKVHQFPIIKEINALRRQLPDMLLNCPFVIWESAAQTVHRTVAFFASTSSSESIKPTSIYALSLLFVELTKPDDGNISFLTQQGQQNRDIRVEIVFITPI